MPDKESVIQALEYLISDGCTDTQFDYCEEIEAAISMLKEQEEIDKNTGEWKNGHCSCCGEDISSMLDTWTNVQSFLFCPNCGAEMKGS